MYRVVGDKAAEFISNCSRLVREYCPLNARNWADLGKARKERLYDKIQGEWNLPRIVGGISVRTVLSSQCAALYRGWRYRLKEKYFVGYTIAQAKLNKPEGIDKLIWEWLVQQYWNDPKQKRISAKNKRSKLKQTMLHSNEAKSTARILEELTSSPQGHAEQTEGAEEASPEAESEPLEPLYVRLYENTNRHATTGLMEPDAEANLKALRELHKKQVEEHGVDNRTPHEAFPMVVKECSGYIRGLGAGPKPPKKARASSDDVRAEIEQIQMAAANKEYELRAEIERLKQESVDRKNRLRQESIERENKLKEESIEREKKLRADIMAELMAMMHPST